MTCFKLEIKENFTVQDFLKIHYFQELQNNNRFKEIKQVFMCFN